MKKKNLDKSFSMISSLLPKYKSMNLIGLNIKKSNCQMMPKYGFGIEKLFLTIL